MWLDETSAKLPPGQTPATLTRFGLPNFAKIKPVVPDRPVLWVAGAVRRPSQFDLAELTALPQRQQLKADFHCVTTWSARDLQWEGIAFRSVHDFLRQRVEPHPDAKWVAFIGLDGYRSCLSLADATADNVILADVLDGARLRDQQGAPARLVAPDHYGYKNVRHVCAIEYRLSYDAGSARWLGHRRGRVAKEERSAILPGWVWRRVWRQLAPLVRRRYAQESEKPAS